jgi:hypothetical protein
MITWFEDLEVTRFLKLRHPPSLEAEKEWVDKVGEWRDHVLTEVQRDDWEKARPGTV